MTIVKEYEVEPPLDKRAVHGLAENDRLQVFPHFPRPYFRIDRDGTWVIQGILGCRTFRVTFLAVPSGEAEGLLRRLLEGFGDVADLGEG